MATETLAVNLLLNASQYKNEARQAASATGQISATAGAAGTATDKLKTGMSTLATTAKFALAGAATYAVVGFAKDSVRAASDLNESINAVRVTFGDAADDVLKIGDNAADSFGLAQSEFNGFAVRFSNFAQTIAGSEGRDVSGVVEELTGRIADFASVMNLDVPEAAEKFQSGLAGQVRPLREFGIDVSAAATNQKALELGLADSTSELTEQDKVLARYKLIMEQTDKTAGDFKNTQDDLANATRTLSANFEDFKARAGEELAPAMAELASTGVTLFDIMDSDLELGWTQRLSAGLQLILGEGSDAVQEYIALKTAAFNLSEENQNLVETTEESIGAAHRHRGAMKDLNTETGHAIDLSGDVAEAWHDSQQAAEDAAAAIEEYDTAFRRQTDPVFRFLDDQRALSDAMTHYQDVLADSKASTEDQEEALFDLLAAQQEVNSSGAALPETMGRSTQAFLALADQLGLTKEQTDTLREALEKIDGKTYRANIEAFFRTGGSQNAIDAVASGAGYKSGNTIFRAEGGPVSAGSPYVVGEKGPELFVPNMSGYVVPNSTTGGGAASGTNIYIGSVYGYDDFVAKVRDAGVTLSRIGG